MSRVSDSLALAASSYNNSRENRLTEIFGTVLRSHFGFAKLLLGKVELPSVGAAEVWRQERLGNDWQIDLILRGDRPRGRSVVYFEHKETGGGWQDGQPWKYLKSLRAETADGAEGKLLVIVAAAEDAHGRVRKRVRSSSYTSASKQAAELRIGADDPLLRYTTWHEIAGWAFEAGQEAAGDDQDWIASARLPRSRSDQRLLAELIWYLEEEGYGMTKALAKEQIDQARASLQFAEPLDHLSEDVGERLIAPETGLGLKRIRGKTDEFRPADRSWLARYGGRIYICWDSAKATDRDGRDQPETGDLVFLVGALVDSSGLKALERKADWEATVAAKGLYIDEGDVVASYDAMRLDGITTLSQQGEQLADWAIDQVRAVLDLKPGPRPRRRSQIATR